MEMMKSEKQYFIPLYLAAIMIIIFAWAQMFPDLFSEHFVLRGDGVLIRPWTFIFSWFHHSGFPHLFSNLFALVVFGLVIEKRIGSKMFLTAFIAGGTLGSIAGIYFYSGVLGASGAIMGIIGTIAIAKPKTIIWALGVPMYAIAAAAAWAVIDALALGGGGGVARGAHIAGLFGGILVGAYLRMKYKEYTKKVKENEIPEKVFREWEEQYMMI